MSMQGSVLAVGKCLACLEFMLLPVWQGIRASSGIGDGWSQGLGRCLRWEPSSPGQGPRMPVFDYPVWLVLCRRGRARLREVCQRGRGVIRLPADILRFKLPQLYDNHQIPKVFREDSIISGYRHPKSSALDCVLSSFHMNNETMNIWTHFLPTWYFLWRFCVLCSTLNFLTDSYTWPLLVYMVLICIYPFTSSCAHTFSTMSPESRHICYFFDYGALSLYSLGCAISYGHYVIPDCWVNSFVHQHFVPIAVGNALFCTSLSCYSRFLELQFPKRSKVMRTVAFIVPFIFDTAPLFYRIVLCCGGNCGSSSALSSHCYHLLFAFLTCFLFTAHLPERLAPGRFDYIGHSHQLFHVSAVVGTHFQMEGVIADMMSRRAWLVGHGATPSFLSTIGVLVVSFALNLGVIGIFSAPLLWKPDQSHAAARERKEQ
ncbi:membrane progestin receptor delta isoform X1 [Solea senegalensis]|uniref:Membrane progestin receptor delta isoform X1 n=1 Tax=Solea senegalensis TaxID=28829 RepID=A0AAV6PQR8_SOLSE|nr:membrane progestin receptor delta isoform X1 [Solea senegalensis]KAG7474705.1 membrane progestin receptor delta isoform X1 [Solea senegalensis]